MSVCALSKAFRRLSLLRKEITTLHYSTHQTAQSELPINISPVFLQDEKTLSKSVGTNIKFSPRSVGLNFNIPKHELPLSKIIESPVLPIFQIDEPIRNNIQKSDIIPNKIIETPPTNNIIEKQAARLIVIRRKKMKKHKRRKFLKRMQFIFRKRLQNKKNLKEKIFQAELQGKIQEAEKFDAKAYVAERIQILTKERLPNKWRGVHLPEAMIRQFLKEREERKAHKLRLRTYRIKVD